MLEVLAALWMATGQDLENNAGRLVEELGSDDFFEREAAEARLRELGSAAREALEAARDHEDLEVRARVRDLLSQPSCLPVDSALRPAVVMLDSQSLETLRAGVEELLKAPRLAALTALNVCAEQGRGRLQFRARQLLDILSQDTPPPLRYGILVSKPEYAVGEKVAGLEIWINDSSTPLRMKDSAGTPTLEEVSPPVGQANVVATIGVGGRKSRNPTPIAPVTLTPGACRLTAREDLTEDRSTPYRVVSSSGWGTRRPGTYVLSSEYQSNAEGVDETAGEAWKGVRRSNRVEFRYR